MELTKFYITGNVAGCSQQEAIEKLSHIEYNLKMAGVVSENIFNTSQIDVNLQFAEEMKIRMEEIAKAGVIVFAYDFDECIECKLEFKEARRLDKHIRMDRLGDYDDIRKYLLRVS